MLLLIFIEIKRVTEKDSGLYQAVKIMCSVGYGLKPDSRIVLLNAYLQYI